MGESRETEDEKLLALWGALTPTSGDKQPCFSGDEQQLASCPRPKYRPAGRLLGSGPMPGQLRAGSPTQALGGKIAEGQPQPRP